MRTRRRTAHAVAAVVTALLIVATVSAVPAAARSTGDVGERIASTGAPLGARVARTDSPDLAAVVLPDGRVRAVGVDSTDRTWVRVITVGRDGTTTSSRVPGPTGVTLAEPRGVRVAGNDAVVAQFGTYDGRYVLIRIDGATRSWVAVDGLGECGGGDGDVIDAAVGADGSVYSVAWNYLGNTPPSCDGTGIRKHRPDGSRVTGFVDNAMEANAIAVGPGGDLYVAGVRFGSSPADEQVAVLRLRPDGTRVTGFGAGNGMASFQPGVEHVWWGNVPGFSRVASSKGAVDVAVDSRGRVLLVGAGVRSAGGDGTTDVWVARLTATGQPDPTFGTGGVALLDLGLGAHEYGLQIAADAVDRPVIGGVVNSTPVSATSDDRAEFTARLTDRGQLDPGTRTVGPRGPDRHLLRSLALGGGNVVTAGALRDQGRGYLTVTPLGSSTQPCDGSSTALFTGMNPWRVLDTRAGSPLQAGRARPVAVAGVCGGVPADAVAVAVNVTVTGPTAAGYLTLYPGGTPPNASTVNFTAGQTVANGVVVGLDRATGSVSAILGAGTADLVLDVMGWFGPGRGFTPVSPVRALDTRRPGGAPLAPGETRQVAVAGPSGPTGVGTAAAVTLNITAVDPRSGGALRAWPGSGPAPWASVLNFTPGRTVANGLALGVDGRGIVSVNNLSDRPTDLVVDVGGTFASGSAFRAITPVRVHDSRDPGQQAMRPWEQRQVTVTGRGGVPGDGSVTAVVVNLTATQATSGGYLSAYPAGNAAPNASVLNFAPGVDVANAVVLGVDRQGRIELRNSLGDTHVVVDVLGWFG